MLHKLLIINALMRSRGNSFLGASFPIRNAFQGLSVSKSNKHTNVFKIPELGLIPVLGLTWALIGITIPGRGNLCNIDRQTRTAVVARSPPTIIA
jgi:hypothetical protein